MVCIQTEVEVDEDKSSSIVVEVIVVVVVGVEVVEAVAIVTVPTIIGSEYQFGKSLLDLCSFVHTPRCAINDLLTLVSAFFFFSSEILLYQVPHVVLPRVMEHA